MSDKSLVANSNKRNLSPAQLHRRYIAALSLIALLTIVSQVVVQVLIADQKHDSRIINIAGRQRMLSQKITKDSIYVVNAKTALEEETYRGELHKTLELWQKSHFGLQNGDPAMGLPGKNSPKIIALFSDIKNNYVAMVDAATSLLEPKNKLVNQSKTLEIIVGNETAFLTGMNAIVFQYDEEAKAKVENARWLELTLMTITLLVLLLEVRFIFAPATRRIRYQVKKLLEREEDMDRLFNVSPIAMVMVDIATLEILDANQTAMELTGFSLDDLRQSHIKDLFVDNTSDYEQFTKAIKENNCNEFEISLKSAEKKHIQTLVSARTVMHSGQDIYVFGFSNISELKKTQNNLEYHANYDKLTGLPNRWMLRNQMELELKKADRSNLKTAVLMLDLDNFKDVNDTLGHDVGDLLLKKAALRLRSCVRDSDIVARLGGDEFIIVLAELSETDSAERVINSILKRIAEPFDLLGDEVSISTSIGVTLSPDDATEIEDLFKNADQAMYAAKQAGRNRHNYFKPSMQTAALEKMQLTNMIRKALDTEQFIFHFQPIVELATGEINKVEALIRWQHPVRGLISPGEFIPVAEGTNFISDIGNLSFKQAARQVAIWRKKYNPHFQISVNISAAQFRQQTDFFQCWKNQLTQLQLSGSGITLEITEGLLLDASEAVKKLLYDFNEAGIEVAIDDFGTGYSSLSYIKKFDIDYIKIDKSFVANMSPGSSDMALCEAIVSMAHKLGLKVIAEGVETELQSELLTEMGCDFAQGYFFSKPLPADELDKLLARQNTEKVDQE